MGEALLWGTVAGSSLLLGAALALWLHPGHRLIGLMMGFGGGALISAVSYELVGDALAEGSSEGIWVGLATGAVAFYLGDRALHHRGGSMRQDSTAQPEEEDNKAIVLGTVLDGIPEGIVLGMSLIGGGGASIAVIAAVFMSNLPEAVSSTRGLEQTMSRKRLWALWSSIALVCAVSSVVGFAFFDGASEAAIDFTRSFAGGALLTMLATQMFPGANRLGGPEAGLTTVLGFATAIALTSLG